MEAAGEHSGTAERSLKVNDPKGVTKEYKPRRKTVEEVGDAKVEEEGCKVEMRPSSFHNGSRRTPGAFPASRRACDCFTPGCEESKEVAFLQ